MKYIGSLAFAGLAILPLLLGAAETLAREDTPAALERALVLEGWAGPPAARLERLAGLAPLRSIELRRRALRSHPRRASAWIALGLEYERSGDLEEAEGALLEAARVDRQLLPAWTLANYYFRRGDRAAFWTWAGRAAERTYDDFRPLLRLSQSMEPDPARALDALGSSARLERAYLDFLIGEQRLEQADAVARRMLARRAPEDRRRLADLVTRQIRAGRAGAALELWNRLFVPLDAGRGPVLTNGDLGQAPTGIGFDWTLAETPGVTAEWSPGALMFTFSGAQADGFTLLEQAIPVAAGKSYRVWCDCPDDGRLQWEWDRGAAGRELATLRLVYRRSAGVEPLRGRGTVRNIRLEVVAEKLREPAP